MSKEFVYTLHELVVQLDHVLDDVLRDRYGASFNLFEFLAAVKDEQPTDATNLAFCLGHTKAAVSKRLPVLQSQGWLTVEPSPDGGRRLSIELTERGSNFVDEVNALLTDMFADLLRLSHTSSDDIGHANRTLTQLSTYLRDNDHPYTDGTTPSDLSEES